MTDRTLTLRTPTGGHEVTFRAVEDRSRGAWIAGPEPTLSVGDVVVAGLSMCRVTEVERDRVGRQTFRVEHLAFYVGNPS